MDQRYHCLVDITPVEIAAPEPIPLQNQISVAPRISDSIAITI
jgi:hypothetical protein